MTSANITAACLLLTVVLFSVHKVWRTAQTWRFLLKGRAMMLRHAQQVSTIDMNTCMLLTDSLTQNPHKAYSLPVPGNKLHILSSKDHWQDINNANTSELSPNAASRVVRECCPAPNRNIVEFVDVPTETHIRF